MSATADIARYKDYFKDLGRGERVEVLAIPTSNQKAIFQRRVSYLEEAFTCTLYWKYYVYSREPNSINASFCPPSSSEALLLVLSMML